MGWPMSRRLVAAGVALVVLALIGGGAFGGVFAADTTGSGLAIDAADGPNGDYADLSNDRITLDLTEGGGVSNDAVTKLDSVFVVTNDRNYAAPVWISDNSSALGFYDTETGESVDSREAAKNLSAGESLRVGVTVDLRDSDPADAESTGGFVVETLVEDATPTETPGDGGSGTDTGGSGTDDGSSGTDSSGSGTDDGSSGTDAGGTATPTATERSGGGGGGGGGGGSGGQQSGSTSSEFTVHNTSEGATVNVGSGLADDPFTADLSGDGQYVTGAGTDVTAMPMALTFDRTDWRVEVTHPTAEQQSAPSVDGDGDVVSYFRADAYNVESSAFDRIGVNATVSLPDGAGPADVAFYRYTGDGWQRVDTTHHGGDRFGADLGGFGEVAVVIESGGGSSGDGSGDGTGDGSGDGTSTGDGSGDGTATPTPDDESADPVVTGTATAVERLEDPLALNSGLGGVTVFVFGLFSVWLAARGRVGGGGSGGL